MVKVCTIDTFLLINKSHRVLWDQVFKTMFTPETLGTKINFSNQFYGDFRTIHLSKELVEPVSAAETKISKWTYLRANLILPNFIFHFFQIISFWIHLKCLKYLPCWSNDHQSKARDCRGASERTSLVFIRLKHLYNFYIYSPFSNA